MQTPLQSHPHWIVSTNLVAFIKQFLHVWLGNFEVDEYFKEDVQNFKKGNIWGFEDSMDPDVQRARAF